MRASLAFGVIAASGFLHLVTGQASYNDEVETGNSAGQDNSPQDTVTVASHNGVSSAPNGQSCSMQDTTTVFVTVYPTSPTSDENASPVDTAAHDSIVSHTVYPTKTISVSPLSSAHDSQPTVQFFTTLTLSDLWVGTPDTESSPETPVSGSNAAPVTTNFGSGPEFSSGPGEYDSTSVGDSGSDRHSTNNVTPYSSVNVGSADNAPENTANAQSDEASLTTVTDTVVEWVTGSDGPSPVTVTTAHTVTLAPDKTDAKSAISPFVTCWTVIGADGKETVIESPVFTKQPNIYTPYSTVLSTVTDGSLGAQGVSSDVPEQTPVTTITAAGTLPAYTGSGMPMSTAVTISGTDGNLTIVHSTWIVYTAPITTASGALPTGPLKPSEGGSEVTSRTTFTIFGSDGQPTVIESTLVVPASAVLFTDLPQNLPNGITAQTSPASQIVVSGLDFSDVFTTCSSYTLLGSDGKLTVVETTYLVAGLTPTASPGASGTPSAVVTGIPPQITAGPVDSLPGQSSSHTVTTCVSYTVIGSDGHFTVVDSTIAEPNSNLLPTGSADGLPSVISQVMTEALPQGTQATLPVSQPFVTRVTVDIVGPNGVVSPVVETVVLTQPITLQPSVTVAVATLGLPSAVSQVSSDLPQGITSGPSTFVPITTALTIPVIVSGGLPSSIIQTIVINVPLPEATSGLMNPFSAAEAPGSDSLISSSLQAYGNAASTVAVIPPPVALPSASGLLPAGTDAKPMNTILTIVTEIGGMSPFTVAVGSPASAYSNHDDSNGQGSPASTAINAPFPNDYAFSSQSPPSPQQPAPAIMQSGTWVNVIPEPTTTYTLKFPMTTLTTVTVPSMSSPARRAIRRQASIVPFITGWSNSSTTAAVLSSPSTTIVESLPPIPSGSTATSLPWQSVSEAPVASVPSLAPYICSAGSKVGNKTLNFDNLKPGPLFNPSGDLWFSQGFLVSPISSQVVQGFMPSSGGQVIKFVPPSLTSQQSSDTAEIGVGPNSPNSCFRFNIYGANLGCAARAAEQWCDFEISAYRYNPAASNEMSIAWSETKHVPACPSFPNSPCPLTPVAFEGYQNITSVLIRLRVGTDLRTWWADDISFGWTDNSCAAAQCRENAPPEYAKREVVESAVRRGVWSWTPAGLQRLDDGFVWDSAF